MFRNLTLVMVLMVFVSSCLFRKNNGDTAVDSELGLVQEESRETAEDAIEEAQRIQLEERQQQLQRQATDPFVNSQDLN